VPLFVEAGNRVADRREERLLVVGPGRLVGFGDVDAPDDPGIIEVIVGIHHVAIGEVTIPPITPLFAPRIPNDKYLVDVRVSDAKHGVTAVTFPAEVARRRHRYEARFSVLVERSEELQPKNDRMTVGEGRTPSVQVCWNLFGTLDRKALGLREGIVVRRLVDVLLVKGPGLLRAGSGFFQSGDRRLEDAAFIFDLFPVCCAPIVVDKQTTYVVALIAMGSLDQILNGPCDGVRRATIGRRLILDGREERAQVDLAGRPRSGRYEAP